MSLEALSQQLLATRDRIGVIISNALKEINQTFSTIYRDMGWFQINDSTSGLRKDVLSTPLLQIIGSTKNGVPIGQIRAIDGRFVILLDASSAQGILNIESRNPSVGESMAITPNTINITDTSGDLLFSISASQDSLGNDVVQVLGQANSGNLNSFSAESNPFWARLIATFKDATDGDVVVLAQAEEAVGTISVKKGSDNAISATVDAAAVVLLVRNAGSDTSIKPESVVTPRLGVGGSAPTIDGYASIANFLGVGTGAPSGSEVLSVAGDTKLDGALDVNGDTTLVGALDVTGDTNLVGALDVSGAITNPLLTAKYVIALLGGSLSTQDAAATRTDLDVYTKAETDAAVAAAVAAAIAALVIDPVGDHTHGGAVPPDGGHTHTIS